jgi:hypothetical protein
MSLVHGCTGDVSTQIAVEATRARALLEARNRLHEAGQQKEEMLENLRSEILRFATFFRHAAADDISRHDPAGGVHEAQRFDNWMRLNDTSVLPTFQDKVFLQSTHEAAIQIMRDSSANLPSGKVAAIKRLAVLEDVIPLADEYRRWKQVLAVVRRYGVLFNGMPAIVFLLLCSFVVPAAAAMISLALMAAAPRAGLPSTAVDVLTLVLIALSLGIALIGFAGPFVRVWIAARLKKKAAINGGFVTSRITSGRVMAALTFIRQKLAALDPDFATQHEILPERMLASLRDEATFLHTRLAAGHLTRCPPTSAPTTSTTITPDASSSNHS